MFISSPFPYKFLEWILASVKASDPQDLSTPMGQDSLAAGFCTKSKGVQGAIFFVAIFVLWKLRNGKVFQDRQP